MAIIAVDTAGPRAGQLTQHYFDARGVARLYRMTLERRLERDAEYSSSRDFAQRFTGTIDGNTIRAAWEKTTDTAGGWTQDFELVYQCR